MSGVIPRNRIGKQLFRLNQISATKKAAIRLPPSLKSVDLIFKKKNSGGHMGLRKFWHNYLPTIQFYNQNLEINVKRISLSEGETDKKKISELENNPVEIAKCPSKIVLSYNSGQKVEIDCKEKHSDEILESFSTTSAAEVVPDKEIVKFASLAG